MDLLDKIEIEYMEQIKKGNEPKYLIVDRETNKKLIELSNEMLSDSQKTRFDMINPERKESKIFGLKIAIRDTMGNNTILDVV